MKPLNTGSVWSIHTPSVLEGLTQFSLESHDGKRHLSVIKACLILRVLGRQEEAHQSAASFEWTPESWTWTSVLRTNTGGEPETPWVHDCEDRQFQCEPKDRPPPWLVLTVITPEWETKWIYFLYKKKKKLYHPPCLHNLLWSQNNRLKFPTSIQSTEAAVQQNLLKVSHSFNG